MIEKSVLSVGMLLWLIAINPIPSQGDMPTFQPLMMASKEKRTLDVEDAATDWAGIFMQPRYLPPQKSRYVFWPKQGTNDFDLVRVNYQVGEKQLTVSQTSCIFALQITEPGANQSRSTLREVETFARQAFLQAEDLELVTTKTEADRLEGGVKLKDNTKAVWLKGLNWWQESGRFGFHFIKTDGTPSAAFKGYALPLNAFWFSAFKPEENPKLQENSSKIVLQKIFEKREEKVSIASKESADWTIRAVSTALSPPSELRHALLSKQATGGIDMAQIRYKTERGIVTLTQTKTVFAAQIDRSGNAAQTLLTLPEVSALAQQLFVDAENMALTTLQASEKNAFGRVSLPKETKAPWLNSLHWWQDAGRVGFYFSKTGAKPTNWDIATELRANAQWF